MAEVVSCPYCGLPAELVDGTAIYPHRPDLSSKRFYRCEPCGAYVGTHAGTTKPLGRLADAELRKAKIEAHAAFDPLWRGGQKARKSAYAWLAKVLAIDPSDCHIGMFDVEMCRLVVKVCRAKLSVRKCDGPSTDRPGPGREA